MFHVLLRQVYKKCFFVIALCAFAATSEISCMRRLCAAAAALTHVPKTVSRQAARATQHARPLSICNALENLSLHENDLREDKAGEHCLERLPRPKSSHSGDSPWLRSMRTAAVGAFCAAGAAHAAGTETSADTGTHDDDKREQRTHDEQTQYFIDMFKAGKFSRTHIHSTTCYKILRELKLHLIASNHYQVLYEEIKKLLLDYKYKEEEEETESPVHPIILEKLILFCEHGNLILDALETNPILIKNIANYVDHESLDVMIVLANGSDIKTEIKNLFPGYGINELVTADPDLRTFRVRAERFRKILPGKSPDRDVRTSIDLYVYDKYKDRGCTVRPRE